MKIIVRIPLDTWAVRYYQHVNRHKLEKDGVTISQTAKDFLGKLITAYMRKTAWEPWCMAIPDQSHIRISLPKNYSRNGLTAGDIKNLSDILTDLAQRDICREVSFLASQPGISRALTIRELFNHYGLSDEEYDQGHFRRYFDRYSKNSNGVDFLKFRKEITRTLIEIYGIAIARILVGEG